MQNRKGERMSFIGTPGGGRSNGGLGNLTGLRAAVEKHPLGKKGNSAKILINPP